MIQQEMLEYQKIDRELTRIEKELRENENYVKFKQYRSMRQACDDNIARAESKAADLKTQLSSCRESIAKITAQIDEYCTPSTTRRIPTSLTTSTKSLTNSWSCLLTSKRK